MKKFIVLLTTLIICLSASFAFAQFNWVTANQGTFAWDAVTVDLEGDPPPEGTHIEYEVFYVNSFVDPSKATPITFERTTLVQSTVTFPSKGRYWVGLQTLLVDTSSGEVLSRSEQFAWSDNPDNCLDGNTFGFQLFGLFGVPGSMRMPTP